MSAPGGSFASDVLGPSLLAAVGLGFSFVPVTIAALTGTNPHEAGLASGLINTSQQVGGALGLAILATVANSLTRHLLRDRDQPIVALTKGFDRAFLVGAGSRSPGAPAMAPDLQPRQPRHVEAAHGEEAGPRRLGGRCEPGSGPDRRGDPRGVEQGGSFILQLCLLMTS